MILHRALRGLLRRAGLSGESAPEPAQWLEFLRLASQDARAAEDEQFRLERSLDVHGREVQALYESLREERRRLSLVLSALREGLLLLDVELNVVLVSPEAEHLTGRSERDWLGQPLDSGLELPPGGRERLLRGERVAGAGFVVEPLDSGDFLVRLGSSRPVETALEEPTREDHAPVPTERTRVLLVEDDPAQQLLLQQLTEGLGHQCILAEDGNEALKAMRRQGVEVVIASQHLTGMSGLELCRQMRTRAADANAYFLLVTTTEAQDEARKSLDQGVDGLLVRPVDSATLSARLRVAQGLRERLAAPP